MRYKPWTTRWVYRLLPCLFMFLSQIAFIQGQGSDCVFSLDIEWKKNFGGSNSEIVQNARQNSDDTYIIAGHSLSRDLEVGDNYGGLDYWVIKTDVTGNLLWESNIGGASTDIGTSIVETSDGGFLFSGGSLSNNNDISSPLGSYDIWLVRLDIDGNILWDKSYGGSGNDRSEWMEKTSDGGYILCGSTTSNDGDVLNNSGQTDAYILKLNAAGNIEWSTTIGGSQEDFANHICPTTDGGYIVSGGTYSFDGDISTNNGEFDAIVFKLDNQGNLLWMNSIGGSGIEWSNWVMEASDGSYIATGPTDSSNGDFSNNNGSRDLWITKFTSAGAIMWTQIYGGEKDELGNAIVETPSNGFLVAGHASEASGDVSNNYGNIDWWVLNIDNNGNLVRDYNYGGSNTEMVEDFRLTNDGGLLLSGFSESDDVDLNSSFGQADFWCIKFEDIGTGLTPPNLGADVEICTAETFFLDATIPNCPTCIYTWSDGVTTPTRVEFVEESMAFSVNIVDEDGCEVSDEILIEFTDLMVDLDFGQPSGCMDDGFINLLPSGGSGDYTFTWNNNLSGSSNQNLGQGFYNILINDGICEVRRTVFLQSTAGNYPVIDLGEDQNICANSSLELSVGNQDGTVLWSTDEDTSTISIANAGFYSVTVTNSEGCSTVDGIDITASDEIDLQLIEDQNTCAPSFLIESGISDVDYEWSNGSLESSITVTETGMYSLTVSDDIGCTKTDEVLITFVEELSLDLGEDQISCFSLELFSPIQNVEYLWQDGSTSSSIIATETGSYTLLITDDNGCTAEDEILVTIDEAPNFDLGANQQVCEEIELSTGLSNVEYLWSDGSTGSNIIATETNSYGVTITNSNGCTSEDEVFIELVASPSLNLSDEIVSCQSVLLDFSENDESFLWSTNEDSNTILISESGDYSVTVTNDFGCSTEQNFRVDIVEELNIDLGTDQSTCETILLSLDIFSAEYEWSNGSILNEIEVSESGVYSVTVTDDTGCSAEDEVEIIILQNPELNLGDDLLSCSSVQLESGMEGLEHLWSTGESGNNINVSESGEYSLTVTNSDGCTSTDILEVTILSEIQFDLGEQIISCEAFDLDSGLANLNLEYFWSTGSNDPNIRIEESGVYQLTITNSDGCSAEDEVEVTLEDPPFLDLGEDILKCGNIVLQTPNIHDEYLWSTGDVQSSTLVSESGMISLLVTDLTTGCSAEDSIMVELTAGFDFDLDLALPTCSGENNGSISIEVLGAMGEIEYQWSDGEFENTRSNLSAGNYIVTITDEADCEEIGNIVLIDPQEIIIELIDIEHISCQNNTGKIIVEATGGTGELVYEWIQLNGQSAEVETSEAGIYQLVVRDINNCTATEEYEILKTEELEIELASIQENACANAEEAVVNVEVISGTAPFVFDWLNMQSGVSIVNDSGMLAGLSAGTYALAVTDATGCESDIEIEIIDPAPIDLEIFGSGSCGDNGIAISEVAGGESPYSYEWSNGALSESVFELADGLYVLTVTDANECSVEQEISIENFEQVLFDFEVSEVACFGDDNAFVSIEVTQGTAPFVYDWVDGFQSEFVDNLPAGSYTVFVSDSNGCQTGKTVDVVGPAEIGLDVVTSPPGSNNNGMIEVNPFGGTPPYNLNWNTGETDKAIFGLGLGTYTVTVTDSNNCTLVQQIELDNSVSIEDKLVQDLTLYPNPTTGVLLVDGYNLSNSQVELQVYNSLGLKIFQDIIEGGTFKTRLNLSNLESGIYFIRFKNSNSFGNSYRFIKI